MSVTVAVVAAHVRQAIGKEGDGNHDQKLSLAAEYHRRGREHKFKKRTNSRRKEETKTGDGVRPGKEARRAAKLARRAAWRAAEQAREAPGRRSTTRSGSLLLFSMAAVSTIGVILVRCIPARRIYIRPPVWGGCAAGRVAAGHSHCGKGEEEEGQAASCMCEALAHVIARRWLFTRRRLALPLWVRLFARVAPGPRLTPPLFDR